MNRSRPNIPNKLMAILIGIGIIAVFTIYVFEFPYIYNVWELKSMLLWSCLTGATIGACLGWKMQKSETEWEHKVGLFAFFTILSIALAPLIFSLLNRGLGKVDEKEISATVLKKEIYSKSIFGEVDAVKKVGDGFYYHFIWRNKTFKLEFPEDPFPDVQELDLVNLTLSKGLLGFHFFNPNQLDVQKL